ncbi:MAG: N-acetylmuramic acid 6-phosphate etherase [Chloroflexota bacterium]
MNKDAALIKDLAETEQRNPASLNFDQLTPLEMVRLMNQEDAKVPLAVAEVLPQIAQTVEWVTSTLESGNRLFTMGAGTSGRLAVLDAAELLPTFRLEPGRVIALLAGGLDALTRSIEGKEDEADQGRVDLMQHDFSSEDMLIAVAASGRTPYALGGLAYAKELGATTVALVCTTHSVMARRADLAIEVVPGPEVLTGSTRLKAGTAQKLVLNMISTCAMAKLGKVFGNLMIDVQPSNIKLRKRAKRIVCQATGESEDMAQKLLEAANWDVKAAVVMALMDVDAQTACQKLRTSTGRVREALKSA